MNKPVRLSGIVGKEPRSSRQRDVESMLHSFNGSKSLVKSADSAVMGWSNHRLSAGKQKDGVTCIIDGDVFNIHELVDRKSEKNIDDRELVIDLYQQHGFESTMQKLNGDYVIALYDSHRNVLWLARDRFGVKPLYYSVVNEELYFASQPCGLLALECIDPEPDPRYIAVFAASHYRVFDNIPESSPYKHIRQLTAASWLRYEPGNLKTGKYWDIRDLPDLEGTEEELAEQYRELLLDAVAVRLQRAGNQAFTLSGGMDSSSVLCSAMAITGQKQNAFSSVYTDRTYDERDDIQDVVREKVTTWYPVEIDNSPDLVSTVQNLVSVHNEPVATATWLSHAVVCSSVAKEGYESLFGGLGGDELNAGEYEYFPFYFADLKKEKQIDKLNQEIGFWAKYHDHPVYKKDPEVAQQLMDKVADFSQPGICKPDRQRISKYADILLPGLLDLNEYEPVMDHPFSSYLKNRTWQDMRRETLPCCLRAEDRQSYAYGLKHFDPFLDYRLVEFMYRVPGALKIRDGVTKRLLRTATTGILPEATRNRIAKTGWNAPVHRWFTGKGAETLRDLVNSRSFRERGVYDVNRILALVDEHETIVDSNQPMENHMMLLWQVLNLELWLHYIDEISAGKNFSRASVNN